MKGEISTKSLSSFSPPEDQERLIFITRKHSRSSGGMQRMSRALEDALQRLHRTETVSLRLDQLFLPFFLLVAAFKLLLLRLGQRETTLYPILLGDALLSPLACLARLIGLRARIGCCLYGLDIVYPSALYQWWLKLGLREGIIDEFFAISCATKEVAVQAGIPPIKISVIAPGIEDSCTNLVSQQDADRFLAEEFGMVLPPGPRLLFVGRLVKRKGTVWFLKEVFPQLKAQFKNLTFMIVGNGPEENELQSAIKSLGLRSNVWVISGVPDTKLSYFYRAATLFIMPNITVPGTMEGFGLVAVEAGLHERWTVASKTEGIVDAIGDGHTGTLVESENTSAYLEAISALLNNEARLSELGRDARKHLRLRPTWDDVAKAYLDKLSPPFYKGS